MVSLVLPMLLAGSVNAVAAARDCGSAYYRLRDGTGVDIAVSTDGHFRWRRPDGTSGLLTRRADGKWSSTAGWTERPDGKLVDLSGCSSGKIVFAGVDGQRATFAEQDGVFTSGSASLAGRLILPEGKGRVPIVVLVHGSEDSSARQTYALQRLLPAQGVGVFVYDKRGTGQSKGRFTHDIPTLAEDARTALDTARKWAGRRAGRIGYYGTSQGGWTAPLAASKDKPDFVIVGYGLAVTPIMEDREAIALDMTRHGFGTAETAKALRIGAAVETIVRSDFQSGFDELRTVLAQYRGEPWLPFVRGNVTGIALHTPEEKLRADGPKLFRGINPDYDPMPVLKALDVRQLWILGGQDIDAPYRETFRRLMALKREGKPISVVVYPDVEHGLYAFETKGEERLSTRQPASLQRLIIDFARGRSLGRSYDNAKVTR